MYPHASAAVSPQPSETILPPRCTGRSRGNLHRMKPDFYTKAILTVIAIALCVLAFKPLFSPGTTASAQSAAFAGVQSYSPGDFFDARTGDSWVYTRDPGGKFRVYQHYKITKLGEPGTWQDFK